MLKQIFTFFIILLVSLPLGYIAALLIHPPITTITPIPNKIIDTSNVTPEHEALLTFLEEDKTDENIWVKNDTYVYHCQNFSRDLQKAALNYNITLGLFSIRAENGEAHTICYTTVGPDFNCTAIYIEPQTDEIYIGLDAVNEYGYQLMGSPIINYHYW